MLQWCQHFFLSSLVSHRDWQGHPQATMYEDVDDDDDDDDDLIIIIVIIIISIIMA